MAFWLLTLLYLAVAVAVVRWTLISALGLWVCTPHAFIKYPTVYKLVPLALLAIAAIVGLSSDIPWYLVIVVLLIARTLSMWVGKKLAFQKVRKEYAEFSESDDTWDPAKASDSELWELAKSKLKYDP